MNKHYIMLCCEIFYNIEHSAVALAEGLLSLKFGLEANAGQKCLETKEKTIQRRLTNAKNVT